MTKKISLILSIALFAAALTQKCYCTTGLCGDSIAVFVFGGFGFLYGGAALCWLANPLLIASWILRNNNKLSATLSLTSSIIAISFLFFNEIIDTEAGHYREIIGYKLGYWLWLASNLIMFSGHLIIKLKRQVNSETKPNR